MEEFVSRPRLCATPARILVVDDNKDGAESLSILLSMRGHDVRTAYDGASALHIAHEHRPHLVLLDIGMPGMNGYEVARRLREDADLSQSVFAAVTGYTQEDDVRRSREAGFKHHLTKPASLTAIEALLAQLPNQFLKDGQRDGATSTADAALYP
jgi:CheY-like chemotaxis protein